jgi:hypothetical protein
LLALSRQNPLKKHTIRTFAEIGLCLRKSLELWRFRGNIDGNNNEKDESAGDRNAMVIEADQGQWLLAKARQLKERALGTADRTRRKQFLLIATEYQKLAQIDAPTDGAIGVRKIAASTNVAGVSPRGQIAHLRPEALSAAPTRSEARIEEVDEVQQRDHLIDLVVMAVVTILAFALVLIPGDQTEGGLRTIFDALFN